LALIDLEIVMGKKPSSSEDSFFWGVFKGLGDLIEKLDDLAEKGDQLKESGENHHLEFKGDYGFSAKVGLGDKGDQKVKVESFGNVHRDTESVNTVVQEMREPVVDVFEEKDHTLVVADMPGISNKEVNLEVKDDLLTILAQKKGKKYRKEILLPRNYPREKMKVSCNNGILEIRCVM
jgi:HSP20 family protein